MNQQAIASKLARIGLVTMLISSMIGVVPISAATASQPESAQRPVTTVQQADDQDDVPRLDRSEPSDISGSYLVSHAPEPVTAARRGSSLRTLSRASAT